MKLTYAAAAVISLAIAGCSQDQYGFFKGDASRERVDKFCNVQASNGARNDAMLYSYHFNGQHLNSLGRQKVLLMLEDCDNCEPVVVHLVNCGEGEMLANRKAAVELYLKTSDDANTVTFHPAQESLIRFTKTESGKADDAAASTDTGSTGIGLNSGTSGAPSK